MIIAEQYARALLGAAQGKDASPEKLFPRFVEALQKRGHKKLLPRIAAEYRKLIAREEGRKVRVRVAHESETEKALSLAEKVAGGQEFVASVDQTLVAGYVVEGRDFRYDASVRRALIDLYRRLTV